MVSANVIEPGALGLRNILEGGGSDEWVYKDNTYGIKEFKYLTPLIEDHIYLLYYEYKYTLLDSSTTVVPTWVDAYYDEGWINVQRVTVNAANTVYTSRALFTANGHVSYRGSVVQWDHMTIYHGPSSNIQNVRGYLRRVTCVDITNIQRLTGKTGNELRDTAWNLLGGESFTTTGNKVKMIDMNLSGVKCHSNTLVGEVVEAEGLNTKMLSSVTGNAEWRYSDTHVCGTAYAPNSAASPTLSLVSDVTSPFYPQHQNVTKITQNGTTTTSAPYPGGLYSCWQGTTGDYVVIEKIVAKIPVGHDIYAFHNLRTPTSTNSGTLEYLSSIAGTGKYEEYTARFTIHASTTDISASSYWAGHWGVRNSSSASESGFEMYVAYIANYKFDADDPLQYFTVMPSKDVVKEGYIMTRQLDSQNLFVNGDGSDGTMKLPTYYGMSYQWITRGDENDKGIHGYHALMQADQMLVGTNAIITVPINPLSRYKLSMRIWCQKSSFPSDMSFLTALIYQLKDGNWLHASNTFYIKGTMTYLTQAAAVGDTVLHVASVNNWTTSKSYNLVGFRDYLSSYHNLGYEDYGSTGIIQSIDTTNNTITLKTALTKAQAVNTQVVEGYSGATYYYPIQRSMLTDGWSEHECYFGQTEIWDGQAYPVTGSDWNGRIPFSAAYVKIVPNFYRNTSGYPIIYDDIRLEEVNTTAEKKRDCVQFKHFS